jgi:hypothetical protein
MKIAWFKFPLGLRCKGTAEFLIKQTDCIYRIIGKNYNASKSKAQMRIGEIIKKGNNIGVDPIPQTPPPFGHLP